MLIWTALIVPIVTVLAMAHFYRHKIAVWEYALPLLLTAAFIGIVKVTAETTQTRDTEYWGGWLTRATYYEDWNERVPCRHPKYRTETYTYSCGDSKSPRTCTGTRQVFDGYHHAYDVDYHSPYWEIEESNGFTFRVSQNKFEEIAQFFGNKTFRELNRDYHTDDGDAYDTQFTGAYEKIIPITTTHSYENRVQASHSVFNYPDVPEQERKALFAYPDEGIFDTPSVLPQGIPHSQEIDKLNALLGAKHEVRVWILVFKDQPREIAKKQEALWKNGNQNELVVCVGIDKERNIQWAETFSWTKAEHLKVSVRDHIQAQKKLDLKELTPFLKQEIEQKWTRRNFKEFSYLSVEPPTWAYITAFVLALATSIGAAAFAVNNEFDATNPFERKRPWRRRF